MAYVKGKYIFFYEYSKSSSFNLFQDAGTAYFIENKEDLGGFVVEELGMYTKYRLAEFYVDVCKKDTNKYCGRIDYFLEGDFMKTDSLKNIGATR